MSSNNSNYLQHLPKLFQAGAAIAALNCFERADFNLPIYILAFLLWDYKVKDQKLRLVYLFIFTAFIDFIWCIYWGTTWGSVISEGHAKLNWMSSVYHFTLIMSVIGLILKLVVVILIVKDSDDMQENLSFESISNNFQQAAGIEE